MATEYPRRLNRQFDRLRMIRYGREMFGDPNAAQLEEIVSDATETGTSVLRVKMDFWLCQYERLDREMEEFHKARTSRGGAR